VVFSDACGGDLAVDGADDAAPLLAAFFGATDLPTVTYLRIFSLRFGLIPLIARKSSTLLNWPYGLRIFTILSAVDGPMPGICCNSSAVAVIRFTGCSGVFCLQVKQARWQKSSTAR